MLQASPVGAKRKKRPPVSKPGIMVNGYGKLSGRIFFSMPFQQGLVLMDE